MSAEAIMRLIERYFSQRKPDVALAVLHEQPVTSLLQDSLDLVDFLVYLEEELKLTREIDMNQFGPSVMNKNFGELADMIATLLTIEEQSQSSAQ